MPARQDRIRAAKQALVKRAAQRPWCVGAGIGKSDDELGLVLSVKQGKRDEAEKLVRELALDVPVRVREVGPVRARARVAGQGREGRLREGRR